jgi:hypothetical protein
MGEIKMTSANFEKPDKEKIVTFIETTQLLGISEEELVAKQNEEAQAEGSSNIASLILGKLAEKDNMDSIRVNTKVEDGKTSYIITYKEKVNQ